MSITASVRGWSVQVKKQTDPFWYDSSSETWVAKRLAVVCILRGLFAVLPQELFTELKVMQHNGPSYLHYRIRNTTSRYSEYAHQ
jgi:hypothetical protein